MHDLTPDLLRDNLEKFIENKLKNIVVTDETKPTPSAAFERVLKRAAQHVQNSGKAEVKGLNILVAMYSERDNFAVFFLEKQDLTRLKVVSYISHWRDRVAKEDLKTSNQIKEDSVKSKSVLDQFCTNLNKKAIP